MAWPIVLANVATPLLGLIDTAVIGNTGSVEDLGAIALGALLFNLVFWTFGFLRMSTTGFIAQALGAGDEAEVRATLARACLIALALGLLLLVLQRPLGHWAWRWFAGSPGVESVAAEYYAIRIWGAPAELLLYVVMGGLIGLGWNRSLLVLQLLLNGLNAALDITLAGVLGWGAGGIALGTAVAGWTTMLLGLAWLLLGLRRRHQAAEPFWPWSRIRDLRRLRSTLGAHSDIMLRTVLMLLAFAWFTNHGAAFGDAVLGANHVLLQLIGFSAFFLDGYAFVAESLIGRAIGAGRRGDFDRVVRRSTVLAAATAALLALAILSGGGAAIETLTDLAPVREAAREFLPWCAVYVLLSFGAFQLDGVFIGATRTRDLRNASLQSVLLFVALAWLLECRLGNHGLWLAFTVYVLARALTLLWRYPRLRASAFSSNTRCQ